MPEAKQFVPEQGACHPSAARDSLPASYTPVLCTKSHVAETFYVGELTGPMAELKKAPSSDDDASWPAWHQCGKAAADKIGRNWLDYRLRLYVYWPSAAAWAAGARWLRCDLVVPRDMARWAGGEISQEQPFSDKVLEGLLLGCFELQEITSGPDSLVTSPCDVPHNAEYGGSVEMPKGTKYPSTEAEWNDVYDHCFGVIAEFVGVRYSALTVGAFAVAEDSTWAEDGTNSVRCYLWLNQRKMTGSAKGTRGVGIPA
jgi:hypothetical protein